MYGLTTKELCDLRLKCLEPYILTASKWGIEQGICIEAAEKSFEFVVKPLAEMEKGTTDKPAAPAKDPRPSKK